MLTRFPRRLVERPDNISLGRNAMGKVSKSPITDDTLGAAPMSFLDPSDAIFHFRTRFSQSNLVSDNQT